MPPASRGRPTLLRVARQTRLTARRYASKQTAPPPQPPVLDKRNLPTRMRTRMKDEPVKTPLSPPEPRPPRFPRLRAFLQNPRYRPYTSVAYTVLITTPILGFVLLHSPIQIMSVTGPSMRPTLNPNYTSDENSQNDSTMVLVTKKDVNAMRAVLRASEKEGFIYRGAYGRGELVIYAAPHNPDKIGIKRVVALPGDRVKPLSGYNDELDPEPVVIPYNHIWLEGDVNDRSMSLDSNYFGPMSQSLIRGKVSALWPSRFAILQARVDHGQYGWPARRQQRVEENAVQSAQISPDVLARTQRFGGAEGERIMQILESQPDRLKHEFDTQPGWREKYQKFWQLARASAKNHPDHDTRMMALQMAGELEKVFGKENLVDPDKKAQRVRWKPPQAEKDSEHEPMGTFHDAVVGETGMETKRADRERPAAKALRDMQAKTREWRETQTREMEERQARDDAKG